MPLIELGSPNPKQDKALRATEKFVCFGGA